MPYADRTVRNEKQKAYAKKYRERHLAVVRARDREKKRAWVKPAKGTVAYRRWSDLRNAAARKRRALNPEKARDYARMKSAEWRHKNPERFKEHWKMLNAKRPQRHVQRYGITEQQYAEMVKAQDGKCAICAAPPVKKILCVDHDHATGEVRGLLCDKCNRGLGQFKDDAATLYKAAMYLTKQQRVAQCS